jgi:hypothetical protein
MKKLYRSKFVAITLALMMIFTSVVSATPTAGAVVCDEGFYASNDVLFYNPCADICSAGGSTGVTVGSDEGLPGPTTDYLNGFGIQEKAELPANKERYLYAESATGLKWQVLAALHYRAAIMDPTSGIMNGGVAFTKTTKVEGQAASKEALDDALAAANEFILMARSVYDIDVTSDAASLKTEQWGSVFLAFDAGLTYQKAGKTYDQSPYVMNGYDTKHFSMAWIGSPVDIGSDRTAGKKDTNKAGALSILAYLEGMTVESDCSSSGAVPGGIVETALNYTLDAPASNGTNDPSQAKQAYREAMPQYNGSNAVYPQVTDCGRFVSTVMHASGADTEFPAVGVGTLISYMNSSSKYEALGSVNFGSLQPGDIMATPGHIILFTGDVNGYFAADASFYERVPSVRVTGSPMWMLSEGAGVWRLK